MQLKPLLLGTVSALIIGSSSLFGATYNVDPGHTNVGFKIKHMMISNVVGHFATFTGSYDLDGAKLSNLKATIEVDSIDTGVAKRDAHLKSADFFDVAKYPEMTFVMTDFKDGQVIGDLTIHGVTRSVALDADVSGTIKDPWGNTRSALELTGKIKRSDFGLKWNQVIEAGGVAVGDDVKLSIQVEGIAAAK